MRKLLLVLIFAAAIVLSTSFAFAKSPDVIKMVTDIEVARDVVVNDVVAVGGDVTIWGRVEGNVISIGGTVDLKPASYVGGEVVVLGDLIKDPAAKISGKITQISMPHFIPALPTMLKGGWITLWATISVLVLLGFLGIAVLLAALMPDHIGAIVTILGRSFFGMLFWGILWMVLIVPIAVLFAISIVGIVLIPIEIFLAVLALIMGYIASAIFIGKSVSSYFKRPSIPLVDAIIGILILYLIGFVPIIGPAAKALFLTAGFGAVIVTRFGTVR